MTLKYLLILSLILVSSTVNAEEKQDFEKPSPEEAKVALLAITDLPEELVKSAELKLGTCIPAVNARHKGQIACTASLIFGAGSSETQLDFYRDTKMGHWIAQPSESQDKLPFPDPKLR